jgi:hypothetical protein
MNLSKIGTHYQCNGPSLVEISWPDNPLIEGGIFVWHIVFMCTAVILYRMLFKNVM